MAALLPRRRYLVVLVAIALVITVVLGGRATWRLVHRLTGPPPPPRQADISAIAGWMSVPYVARAYRVPAAELFKALGVSPAGHRTSTLDDLARETGRTPDETLRLVREAVRAWQETHPPPPRPPPPV